MTWVDQDGVKHVSASDIPNREGDKHILECEQCAENFPVSAAFLRQAKNRNEGEGA